MKQEMIKLLEKAAVKTAIRAGDSASFFGMCQPMEPLEIKKENE